MSETKSTWSRRVANWRASGLTADEFAAEHGFRAPTLRWWASRLKREEMRQAAALVPLARVIRSPAQPVSRGTVVIDALDLRARVTVETGVERETLDAVFGALGIGGAR
ncbi:MAG TPA: hypothetical protein VMU96_12275 [Casimicrobiaceae bacterium]|nr:hypothetical protein [Casimicrobiaceae bacterium]